MKSPLPPFFVKGGEGDNLLIIPNLIFRGGMKWPAILIRSA
jgi:hypothetical protein